MTPELYSILSIGKGLLYAMAKPSPGEALKYGLNHIATMGVTRIVSLLEVEEAANLGLGNEKYLSQNLGLEFVHFPIADFGVPTSPQAFSEFVKQQYLDVLDGQRTVVHCRAGIGRTGIVTASLLLHCGYTPLEAFEKVSAMRGESMPDSQQQIDWVVNNQLVILGE